MREVNHVMVGGNLGQNPEVRHKADGEKVISFNLALSKKHKSSDGQIEEMLQWVRIVCFSDLAKVCYETLSKGDEVLVYGKLTTKEWKAQGGDLRKSTEIRATEINFLKVKKWAGTGTQ
jgi:single-strand DNA-binding protein